MYGAGRAGPRDGLNKGKGREMWDAAENEVRRGVGSGDIKARRDILERSKVMVRRAEGSIGD